VQLGYSSQTAHDTRPMSPLANLTSGIAIPPFAGIRSISMFAIALHVCNRTVKPTWFTMLLRVYLSS